MKVVQVTKDFTDFAAFDEIFMESFPPEERVLPSEIVHSDDFLLNAFYLDEKPAGMTVSIPTDDFVLFVFLVVSSKFRGQGLGTKIVDAYFEEMAGKLIFGFAEKPDENAENNAQRIARLEFYDRLGFSSHNVGLKLNGIDMVALSKGPGADDANLVLKYTEQAMKENLKTLGLPKEMLPVVTINGKKIEI